MISLKSPKIQDSLPQRTLNALDGAGQFAGSQPVPDRQDSPYSLGRGAAASAATIALIALKVSVFPVVWWRVVANRGGGTSQSLAADVLALLLVALAVTSARSIRRLTEPPRHRATPAAIQRLGSHVIEASWFGVGPKRRWTWVQSTRPLRWLTGVVPHRHVSAHSAADPGDSALEQAPHSSERRVMSGSRSMPATPGDLERSRLCLLALSVERPNLSPPPAPNATPRVTTDAVPVPTSQAKHQELTTTTAKPWPVEPTSEIQTGVEYVVQRGDTWWSLAQTHLGDGRRWADLQELNRSHRGSDDATGAGVSDLLSGHVIQLPLSETR